MTATAIGPSPTQPATPESPSESQRPSQQEATAGSPLPRNPALTQRVARQVVPESILRPGRPNPVDTILATADTVAFQEARLIRNRIQAEQKTRQLIRDFSDIERIALTKATKPLQSSWILLADSIRKSGNGPLNVTILDTNTLEEVVVPITDSESALRYLKWAEAYQVETDPLQEFSRYIEVDLKGDLSLKKETLFDRSLSKPADRTPFPYENQSWKSFLDDGLSLEDLPRGLQYSLLLKATKYSNSGSGFGNKMFKYYIQNYQSDKSLLINKLREARTVFRLIGSFLDTASIVYHGDKLSKGGLSTSERLESGFAVAGGLWGMTSTLATFLKISFLASAGLPVAITLGAIGYLTTRSFRNYETTTGALDQLIEIDQFAENGGMKIEDGAVFFHGANKIDFSEGALLLDPGNGIRFKVDPVNELGPTPMDGRSGNTFDQVMVRTALAKLRGLYLLGRLLGHSAVHEIEDHSGANLHGPYRRFYPLDMPEDMSLGHQLLQPIDTDQVPNVRILPRGFFQIEVGKRVMKPIEMTPKLQAFLQNLMDRNLVPKELILDKNGKFPSRLFIHFDLKEEILPRAIEIQMDAKDDIAYVIPPSGNKGGSSYQFTTHTDGGSAIIAGLSSQSKLSLKDPENALQSTQFYIPLVGASLSKKENVRFETEGTKKYLRVQYDDGTVSKIDISELKNSKIRLMGTRFIWEIDPKAESSRIIEADFRGVDKAQAKANLEQLTVQGLTAPYVTVHFAHHPLPRPRQDDTDGTREYLTVLESAYKDTLTTIFDSKTKRIIGYESLYQTVERGSKLHLNINGDIYFFNAARGRLHYVDSSRNEVTMSYQLPITHKDMKIRNLVRNRDVTSFELIVPYGNPQKFCTWKLEFKSGERPRVVGISGLDAGLLAKAKPPTQEEKDRVIQSMIGTSLSASKEIKVPSRDGYFFRVFLTVENGKVVKAEIRSVTQMGEVLSKVLSPVEPMEAWGRIEPGAFWDSVTYSKWIKIEGTHANGTADTTLVHTETGRRVPIEKDWQFAVELHSPSNPEDSILVFHSPEKKEAIFVSRNGRSLKVQTVKNVGRITSSPFSDQALLIAADGKMVTAHNPFTKGKKEFKATEPVSGGREMNRFS